MIANLLQFIDFEDMRMIDLDQVYDLECRSYEFPWSRNILKDCLLNKYDFYIASYNNKIIGYVISKISAHESHILNLTIDQDYRGNGIASELIEMIIAKCHVLGSKMIFLETRVTNKPAKKLYEKYNFHTIGIRKGYYKTSAGREDAVVYRCLID